MPDQSAASAGPVVVQQPAAGGQFPAGNVQAQLPAGSQPQG